LLSGTYKLVIYALISKWRIASATSPSESRPQRATLLSSAAFRQRPNQARSSFGRGPGRATPRRGVLHYVVRGKAANPPSPWLAALMNSSRTLHAARACPRNSGPLSSTMASGNPRSLPIRSSTRRLRNRRAHS